MKENNFVSECCTEKRKGRRDYQSEREIEAGKAEW